MLPNALARGKSRLEVIVAHWREDFSWSDVFAPVRTVYTKAGGDVGSYALHLLDRSRELDETADSFGY